jgi:hypothetical protein
MPAIVSIRSFSENHQTSPSRVAATAMFMTPGRMQGLLKEKIKTGMCGFEMKENSLEGCSSSIFAPRPAAHVRQSTRIIRRETPWPTRAESLAARHKIEGRALISFSHPQNEGARRPLES